ncbi:MAG: Eco57I restriction-modification methylase domain-containing protein [Candidatus Thorarchaeota archaeon]
MAESKSNLDLISKIEDRLTLDGRKRVFEDGEKLSSDHLLEKADPEAFTKEFLIEPIFDAIGLEKLPERHFRGMKGDLRKADYQLKNTTGRLFLSEVKPINTDLFDKSPEGAVNQIEGLFRLAEVRDTYDFGIATDGLKWVFIDKKGKQVYNYSIHEDLSKIEDVLKGKSHVSSDLIEEEITKKFYEWYNALMHGGSYRDHNNKTRKISEKNCLIENVLAVSNPNEREQIAQIVMDRLIFIKFLQSRNIIRSEVLDYLSELDEDILNEKMKQLFFQVINVEMDLRTDIDPKFKEIPYLNGNLYTRMDVERKNPDYRINALILKKVIEFLDSFRFLSDEGLGEKEILDPEILGYIFERAMTATDRKGTGAYYTPKTITQYISENTIYPALLGKINRYLEEVKGYKQSELLDEFGRVYRLRTSTLEDIFSKIVMNFKVCDNACGSGAFLLAAANILFGVYKRINDELRLKNPDFLLKKIILLRNLFGVDINPNAIEIAKLRLWLWLAGSYDPEKIEALPNIDFNLRTGNSLLGLIDINKYRDEKITLLDYFNPEESLQLLLDERSNLLDDYRLSSGRESAVLKSRINELHSKIAGLLDYNLYEDIQQKGKLDQNAFLQMKPFHWGFEFHKVFTSNTANSDGGFDVVIGNPPYGLLRKIVSDRKTKKVWRVVYDSVYSYQKGNRNLYKLFIERSASILAPNAYFGMIFPTAFFGETSSTPLRKHLVENYSVKEILQFPEKTRVFVGVTQDVSILTYENDFPPDSQQYIIRLGSQISDFELSDLSSIEHVEIAVGELSDISHSAYAIPTLEEPLIEWAILKHIIKLHPPLGGDAKNLSLADAFEGHLHETSDRHHMSTKKTSDILVKGIHLDRYHVDLSEDGRQPRWMKDKAIFFKDKPAAKQAAEVPKIVGKSTINKQIPRRMQFSILEPGIVVTNNVKFLTIGEDTLPGYLLAILNSGLAEWFISKFATTNRITNYEIENLPVPRCSHEQQVLLDSLAKLLLFLKKENGNENEFEIVDRLLDACIYELYFGFESGLVPILLKLVEQRGARIGELRGAIKALDVQKITLPIYKEDWVNCICNVLRKRERAKQNSQ